MMNSIAVDTNILIYLHDRSDEGKRAIAEKILSQSPAIPAQVISEYINVTRRLLDLTKVELLGQSALLFKDCDILPVSANVLLLASKLTEKYSFQIFDAIVVATALSSKCTILYSEDMQHKMTVDGLTIINPFAV